MFVMQPADTGDAIGAICLQEACLVPNAKHVVTTAGRPSGMAATASATAILK